MNLVIVESPTKARTIQRFLSADFAVKSSYGHVRDLPKKELGVDIQNNFTPKYVVPLLARKRLTEIKKALPKSKKVILATDEDREGEAIAWHLTQALGLPTTDYRLPQNKKTVDGSRSTVDVQRIVFHEITKKAIEQALKNPRAIDMNLVDAQQARRILDRLVGYELSPFLWRKVAKGLSAGRVQSVAVRLIVEREREIQNFKPEEYWTVVATLLKIKNQKSKIKNHELEALLVKKDNKPIPKLGIKSKEETDKILKDLEGAQYQVADIEKKETHKNPLPPFTTSTLQQQAWQKLHFSVKTTMALAQNLYENGHITYHRTDSLNISEQALFTAKKFIIENYGQNYWAGYLRKFKTKSKGAQEAHEAIRPTNPHNSLRALKEELEYSKQFGDKLAKLYDLIWQRFIASQMAPAIFDSTIVDIAAKNVVLSRQQAAKNLSRMRDENLKQVERSFGLRPQDDAKAYTFRATGQMMKFDGFLKIYPIKFQETDLPPLENNEILQLLKLSSAQHFTQPPTRYSEASLIKVLEQNGIGRPSTYAPIISTIQERNYVQKDEKRNFFPTDIGFTVNDLLVEHFPEIVDLKFTATIEEDLDEIAQGQVPWVPVIREFYEPFKKNLTQKYDEVEKQKAEPELTDKTCPKCGKPLVIRTSRFGKFYACSDFPRCRYTENLVNSLGIVCPKCIEGEIVAKKTKKGKMFYACSRWPDCDFALWDRPTGEKCPECGSLLAQTNKGQIKCSNKECSYKEKKIPD